jgi:hypothetical protein
MCRVLRQSLGYAIGLGELSKRLHELSTLLFAYSNGFQLMLEMPLLGGTLNQYNDSPSSG